MSSELKLKAQDRQALEDFLTRVRTALGDRVLALKLFGSKATGRDNPDSDIDVLVVVNETSVEVENRVIDIAFDVNLEHDVYISPMVVARAVFDDPVWSITPFIRTLEREGISL